MNAPRTLREASARHARQGSPETTAPNVSRHSRARIVQSVLVILLASIARSVLSVGMEITAIHARTGLPEWIANLCVATRCSCTCVRILTVFKCVFPFDGPKCEQCLFPFAGENCAQCQYGYDPATLCSGTCNRAAMLLSLTPSQIASVTLLGTTVTSVRRISLEASARPALRGSLEMSAMNACSHSQGTVAAVALGTLRGRHVITVLADGAAMAVMSVPRTLSAMSAPNAFHNSLGWNASSAPRAMLASRSVTCVLQTSAAKTVTNVPTDGLVRSAMCVVSIGREKTVTSVRFHSPEWSAPSVTDTSPDPSAIVASWDGQEMHAMNVLRILEV